MDVSAGEMVFRFEEVNLQTGEVVRFWDMDEGSAHWVNDCAREIGRKSLLLPVFVLGRKEEFREC